MATALVEKLEEVLDEAIREKASEVNFENEIEKALDEYDFDSAIEREVENFAFDKHIEDALENYNLDREVEKAVENALDDADIDGKAETAVEGRLTPLPLLATEVCPIPRTSGGCQMPAETINGWTISSESEMFRIFPKNRQGEVRPVTKINQFLRLRNSQGGDLTIKRYFHQGQWYWRLSTEDKPVYDLDVRDQIARTLFPIPGKFDGEGRRAGDRHKAEEVLVGFLTGRYAT